MVVISVPSFAKIVLHCYKYPSLSVFGFVLGMVEKQNVIIKDAIPVFHGTFLSPMLEMSFKLIENHAKNNGLSIVGCYYGDENNSEDNNNELPFKIQEIQSKIFAFKGTSIVLHVQNDQLTPIQFSNLPVYTIKENKQWDRQVAEFENVDETAEFLEKVLSEEKWIDLNDFENHLQDLSKDWLNTSLFT